MKAAFIVMSILGCDDAGATCTPVAQVEQQWQTIAACDAASEDHLARYTNVNHPMVVAVCQTADSTALADSTEDVAQVETANRSVAPIPQPPLDEAREDGIAVLTINRSEQRNCLSLEVREGLREAWDRFERDPAMRVAILTGSGDKAFCAGGDLKEMVGMGMKVPPRDLYALPYDTIELSKPTIAAVNGHALAGGWMMAQACDLCVASTNATFVITEARIGRELTGLLDRAEAGTGLDKMDAGGFGKIRHDADDAKEIGHQRAPPGTELGEDEFARRAHRLPDHHGPHADQLAEHLAHLRRGDEIAVAAERLAAHVVAIEGVGEAGLHVGGERHRPVGADAGDQLLAERRHASLASGRRDALTIRKTP